MVLLPTGLGKSKSKPKFSQVFSKTPTINWLSAARFFLFGSRDVWFVVALPVYLYSVFQWGFMQVGGFIALWIIGYGVVQASAPRLIRHSHHGKGPDGATAKLWAFVLAVFPAGIALGLSTELPAATVLVAGLIGCLICSSLFVVVAGFLSMCLPNAKQRESI